MVEPLPSLRERVVDLDASDSRWTFLGMQRTGYHDSRDFYSANNHDGMVLRDVQEKERLELKRTRLDSKSGQRECSSRYFMLPQVSSLGTLRFGKYSEYHLNLGSNFP